MCVRLASPVLRVASLPHLDLRNLPIHSLELHRNAHVLRSIDLSGCFNLKAEHIHMVRLKTCTLYNFIVVRQPPARQNSISTGHWFN